MYMIYCIYVYVSIYAIDLIIFFFNFQTLDGANKYLIGLRYMEKYFILTIDVLVGINMCIYFDRNLFQVY